MASSRIFIGNLPFTVSESELENMFTKLTEVHSVRLVKDQAGKSRGFGFAEVADPDHVIESLDEKDCQGCALVVKYAVDRGDW